MGTASVRLHDGTIVTARFDDNADGMIQEDERSRAQNALRAELVRRGYSGALIDADASIYVLEDGTSPSAPAMRESTLPVGDLARTGTVRLFGANPARTRSGFSDPALWAPTHHEIWPDGTRAVIYHEADRWDETNGTYIWGRTLRVTEDGRRHVWEPGDSSHSPGTWLRLETEYTPPAGNRIPSLRYIPPAEILPAGSIPAADGREHKVAIPAGPVTARAWDFVGVRDGYQYYQAGGLLARRSVANPDRDEVMVSRGSGSDGLAGAVWRAADGADAVPNPARVNIRPTGSASDMRVIDGGTPTSGPDAGWHVYWTADGSRYSSRTEGDTTTWRRHDGTRWVEMREASARSTHGSARRTARPTTGPRIVY